MSPDIAKYLLVEEAKIEPWLRTTVLESLTLPPYINRKKVQRCVSDILFKGGKDL